jgi:two-component system, LytTR family, sensor kinase
MPWWLLWAVLTPLVFALARRFRLDGRHRWAAALAHLAAGLVVSLVHLGVIGVLYYYTITHGTRVAGPLVQVENILDAYLVVDIMTYFAVVGAWYALEFAERVREREVAALQLEAHAASLEAQMAEARLSALRMELNPHFLFNALNALSTLIVERRTSEASQMLSRVSDFLRHTLAAPDRPEVTLEEELALTTLYLEIERVRLGERLDVRLAVPHGIRRARVPSFLLQPLVENAVRHGIAPHEAGGTLLVTAERTGDTLRLVVRNEALTEGDAVGVAAVVHRVVEERATEDDPASRGIGLANTRARLEALYGQRQRLALAPVGPTGAEVIVELPYRETAP